MTTQVFRGPTLDSARKAAVKALGKDAVVLTTRHVRVSGIAGLLGGTECEIAAAVIDAPPLSSAAGPGKGPFASSAYDVSERAATRDPLAALRAELRAEIRAAKIAPARPAAVPNDLLLEMAAMREALDGLVPQPKKGDKVTRLVHAAGIEGTAATALARRIRARKDDTLSPEEQFRNAASELVRVTPWPLTQEGRVVVAVVGPTGVGKTTTLAKLAALVKIEGRTATLVTCDTFRVGGVEHVGRYADLLDMPTATARDTAELSGILSRARTDFVFVDTSGRAPLPDASERILAEAPFNASDDVRGFSRHVLLCLPANVRAVDALRAMKAFSAASPTALAITKLDETDAPSGLVHAAFVTKLPVAVLSSGQRVPEDLAPATMGAILDALTRPLGRRASE